VALPLLIMAPSFFAFSSQGKIPIVFFLCKLFGETLNQLFFKN
jgi:hypothetical protein